MRENLLILVGRSPVAGTVKPRLSPPLTAKQACAAYAAMLLDTEQVARAIPAADLWFACPNAPSESLRGMLSDGTRFLNLTASTDGGRLEEAFNSGIVSGYRHVAVLVTDVPDLPAAYVQTAFDRLREDPALAVFGPTFDGGYYLVGLSQARPELFRDIPWHDQTTWLATRAAATRAGIPVAILPRWQDVDTWADLQDCLARGGAPHLQSLSDRGMLKGCETV